MAGRRLIVAPAVEADLRRLKDDDPRLAVRARALIGLIHSGEVTGAALQLLASYGDLRDCRKVYFGRTAGEISHRVVYRSDERGPVEIVEVVAVESREEGYAYLLAASRLGRLPTETRPRFDRGHQAVIARRSRRRR